VKEVNIGCMGARVKKMTMRIIAKRRVCHHLRSATFFGEKIQINQPKVVRREER
jgi:hypothetical protein